MSWLRQIIVFTKRSHFTKLRSGCTALLIASTVWHQGWSMAIWHKVHCAYSFALMYIQMSHVRRIFRTVSAEFSYRYRKCWHQFRTRFIANSPREKQRSKCEICMQMRTCILFAIFHSRFGRVNFQLHCTVMYMYTVSCPVSRRWTCERGNLQDLNFSIL